MTESADIGDSRMATEDRNRGSAANTTENLGVGDFARIFGISTESIPEECRRVITASDFRYSVLTGRDRELAFLENLVTLESGLPVSGQDQQDPWDQIWAANLKSFIESDYDTETLVPSFSKDKRVLRLEGEFIQVDDPGFEVNFVAALRFWLFSKWFKQVDHLYEFGCGTGHNLVAFSQLFPDKELHGMDWANASTEIISLLAQKRGLNITGRFFDMLSPDPSVQTAPNSGVLTFGAMEQLGTSFQPFLDFLLQKTPAICVHIETLYETHDEKQLFDYMAGRYLRERGYLQGFLPELRRLEEEGRIEILQLQQFLGCRFHDNYSCVVWRPVQPPTDGNHEKHSLSSK